MQKEAIIQAMIFEWAKYMSGRYPELEMMYHIPNGGSRNKREAANLKRQGVKSGVPDICLPAARGGYHGLYIELKQGKNKPSKQQLAWIEKLAGAGYVVAVCYGYDEAVRQIKEYLKFDEKTVS